MYAGNVSLMFLFVFSFNREIPPREMLESADEKCCGIGRPGETGVGEMRTRRKIVDSRMDSRVEGLDGSFNVMALGGLS